VKTWFQNLLSKCNLHRYVTAVYEGFFELDKRLMVDGSIGNLCRPCGHPAAAGGV
jgi:hypothetical protein